MIHPWHEVTPSVNDAPLPRHFRAVIEIPKGSSNKYELEKSTGMLKLDRVLASAVYYPANYGFIPQTLAEDDDPLDVLVFSTEQIPPLCICEAQAVGMMSMIDEGAPDHKIVAVLREDPVYSEYTTASDFPKHTFKMLKRFLEEKSVEVDEILPPEAADASIADAIERYSQTRVRGTIQGLR